MMENIKQENTISISKEQTNRIDSLLAESESLNIFVQDRIIRGPGDLSVSEIETAYADYCAEKGWTAKSLPEIRNKLEGLMLEIHRTAKNHCTKRDGKSVRGFANVTLV